MKERPAAIDQRLVRALAHPLRVRILEVLTDRIASPSGISAQLGSGLTDVAYHTRALDRYGCLDLVGTARRRGATEHFYKAQPRAFIGDRGWRSVPAALRGGVSAAALQTFIDKAVDALEAGTIAARDDASLCWTPMRLDLRGWEEIAAIVEETFELVLAAEERSRKRLARHKTGEELSTVFGIAHFETGGSARRA